MHKQSTTLAWQWYGVTLTEASSTISLGRKMIGKLYWKTLLVTHVDWSPRTRDIFGFICGSLSLILLGFFVFAVFTIQKIERL